MNPKKRVLLVYPPTTMLKEKERKRVCFPLGMAYIAAVLEKNGYSVKCLDTSAEGAKNEVEINPEQIRFGLPPEKIKEAIQDFKPDYVGVSVSFTNQAENGHMICSITKEVDKNITTIMGGAYPTSDPEGALSDANLDFVINGEGERTIIQLLGAIDTKQKFREILGISFRDDSKVCINPPMPFIENLDEIPFPARHLFDFEIYSNSEYAHGTFKEKPLASIITSRGCPFNCAFCFTKKMVGTRFRERSVDNVISEIKHLISRYGVKEIHFEDDNLLFDKKRAKALFDELIGLKMNISWTTPNGIAVANLDKKILSKMKESGMYSVIIAVESGNQRVLREILRKPLILKKVEEVVEILKDIEIPVAIYWMIGLPGETKEEMEDTIELAEKLNKIYPRVYSSFSCYTPFKGSDLYALCKSKNLINEEKDLSHFKYCESVLTTPEFTSEYVTKLRKVAWQRANRIKSDTDLAKNDNLKIWVSKS